VPIFNFIRKLNRNSQNSGFNSKLQRKSLRLNLIDMKKFLLYLLLFVFTLSCKKDDDSKSNPDPTPSSSCRVKSSEKGGRSEFEITYDTKGRLTRLVKYSGAISTGYFTYTMQYQEGSNKAFIGTPGTTELYEAELNSAGYITKVTQPGTFSTFGNYQIRYNSSNRITQFYNENPGGKFLVEFSYTNGDLTKILIKIDTSTTSTPAYALSSEITYEYADNMIYKVVPGDLLFPNNNLSLMPVIFDNQTNRKIPSKSTRRSIRFSSPDEVENYSVQIKDGSLPKTVNSATYSYENCN